MRIDDTSLSNDVMIYDWEWRYDTSGKSLLPYARHLEAMLV